MGIAGDGAIRPRAINHKTVSRIMRDNGLQVRHCAVSCDHRCRHNGPIFP